MSQNLTFAAFSKANMLRCTTTPKFIPSLKWSLAEWGNAVAGEVGEGCNLAKKELIGEQIDRRALGKEIADAISYLDLMAQMAGLTTEEILIDKFNEISDRVGSDVKI